MSTNPAPGTLDRLPATAQALLALCLLVALPCVVVVGPAAASGPASVTAAEMADDRATEQGLQSGSPAVSPAGTSASQLSGVVLVLIVLAIIGAVVWGTRPILLDRVAPVSRWRALAPGGGSTADAHPASPAVEGELLTDEERIIALLEENEGRLKQQHVVETTDWSKAKVSRLLSSMEDDEAIVRIQLGREKLIFLSGHEPSGARPAHRGED